MITKRFIKFAIILRQLEHFHSSFGGCLPLFCLTQLSHIALSRHLLSLSCLTIFFIFLFYFLCFFRFAFISSLSFMHDPYFSTRLVFFCRFKLFVPPTIAWQRFFSTGWMHQRNVTTYLNRCLCANSYYMVWGDSATRILRPGQQK